MSLTPEGFERIARKLAPNAEDPVFIACPDQAVGTLAQVFGADRFNRTAIEDPPLSARVILVLESPHRKEFDEGHPVGPANGPTGSNIRCLLEEVIGNVGAVDVQAQLILMNAVQYQCSQGEEPIKYRDDVFVAAWDAGGKEDFQDRLRAAVNEGDIVINACTRGTGKIRLRELVKVAIEGVVGEHWRTAHPAAWRYPGRTKVFTQPGKIAP